jgi:hypothetical protein
LRIAARPHAAATETYLHGNHAGKEAGCDDPGKRRQWASQWITDRRDDTRVSFPVCEVTGGRPAWLQIPQCDNCRRKVDGRELCRLIRRDSIACACNTIHRTFSLYIFAPVWLEICWFLLDPIYNSNVAVLDGVTRRTAFRWTGITADHCVHLHAFIMGGAKRHGSEAIHLCGRPKPDFKVSSFCNRISEYAAEERADA